MEDFSSVSALLKKARKNKAETATCHIFFLGNMISVVSSCKGLRRSRVEFDDGASS